METLPPSVLILSVTQGSGSGAERVLAALLEGGEAAGWNRRVTVAVPRGSLVAGAAKEGGYAVVEWSAGNDRFLSNLAAARRFPAPEPRPSLVHAWHVRAWEWGLFLGRRYGVPVGGTVHDAVDGPMHGPFRRFLSRRAAGALDGVAAVSRATAAGWEPFHPGIEIIPNGLPDRPRIPRGKGEGSLRVGFLGCGTPWKGFSLLPGLVARTRDLPVQWSLYGDPAPAVAGPLRALLASDGGRVRHEGRRSPEEIHAAIDLVIHPSLGHDPFPTVLLEAARAGLPSLASAAGGTAEIVRDGETGLLFPPGDAEGALAGLRRLASDCALREEIGRAARARYEAHFQIDRMRRGYEDFWRSLPGRRHLSGIA